MFKPWNEFLRSMELVSSAHFIIRGSAGRGWTVYSHKTGRKLSRRYGSRKAAIKRLRQIQYFKHRGH